MSKRAAHIVPSLIVACIIARTFSRFVSPSLASINAQSNSRVKLQTARYRSNTAAAAAAGRRVLRASSCAPPARPDALGFPFGTRVSSISVYDCCQPKRTRGRLRRATRYSLLLARQFILPNFFSIPSSARIRILNERCSKNCFSAERKKPSGCIYIYAEKTKSRAARSQTHHPRTRTHILQRERERTIKDGALSTRVLLRNPRKFGPAFSLSFSAAYCFSVREREREPFCRSYSQQAFALASPTASFMKPGLKLSAFYAARCFGFVRVYILYIYMLYARITASRFIASPA